MSKCTMNQDSRNITPGASEKAFAIIPVDGREMNVSNRPTTQAHPLSIGYADNEGLRSMLQLLLMRVAHRIIMTEETRKSTKNQRKINLIERGEGYIQAQKQINFLRLLS